MGHLRPLEGQGRPLVWPYVFQGNYKNNDVSSDGDHIPFGHICKDMRPE
jgi:hypothetical protein